MELDLIFVHVPKTGGVAMRTALDEHFGATLHLDYVDQPGNPTAPMNMDPAGFLSRYHASGYPNLLDKKAVFGHYWIKKYDPLSARIRATVLREPIARALSHYFYILSFDYSNDTGKGHFLWRYITDNKINFLEFCRFPLIRNYYTKLYFREVDMKSMDIVFDYNKINLDWRGCLEKLGLRVEPQRLNETPGDDYKRMKEEVMQDSALMGEIRSLLVDDVTFYERWAS